MPKQVIDLRPGKQKRLTVLSYGRSRSGKTRYAGTWPRPIFLSDNSEGGWETLRNMNAEALYEPDRRPEVWAIESAKDMLEGVQEIEQIVPKEPDRFKTVVIDSLTFYADSYYAGLEQQSYATSKQIDPRRLFQSMASHLRYLMIRVHQLPLNVVWLCLEKPPGEDGNNLGGILLAGQSGVKSPARCDYIFYHRSFRKSEADPLNFEIRTQQYGSYIAGGRDEGLLPDPLEPSYRAVEDCLGIAPFQAAGKSAVKAVK